MILPRTSAALLLVVAVVVGWLLGPEPASGQPEPPPPPPPVPSAAPAPVPPPGPMPASHRDMEQHLADMHFDVGTVDDVPDAATSNAVMAFQKTYDLPRTGELNDETLTKIASNPPPPAPLKPDGEPHRVEVDLNRQVLYLYEGGALSKIVPVSSGNGERFCSQGRCRNAVTPTGAFRVYRQGHGWERGPLGSLYNPAYFVGGVAIHGSESVPATPASHGCVRIPMGTAEWFPSRVPVGTPVYVF